MSEESTNISDGLAVDTVELATALTIAWLGNAHNRVTADDVPAFLNTMHQTVTRLTGGTATAEEPQEVAAPTHQRAVSVRKSLASKDHIISMIDGKPYRTLRKHLSTNGLTPDEYRHRYGLKPDYPMVAETYSDARREMARKIGLGRKRTVEAPAEPAAAPRRRRAKADAA